jgi:predicted lactoylglutathione lyase
MTVPSGTESARAFLPAKDFETSKSFYEALGFRKLLDSEVAILAWAKCIHLAAILSEEVGGEFYDAVDGR